MKHRYIEDITKVANVLKFIGISVIDSNGTFKSFPEIMRELGRVWKALGNERLVKREVSICMAGIRKSVETEVYLNNLN